MENISLNHNHIPHHKSPHTPKKSLFSVDCRIAVAAGVFCSTSLALPHILFPLLGPQEMCWRGLESIPFSIPNAISCENRTGFGSGFLTIITMTISLLTTCVVASHLFQNEFALFKLKNLLINQIKDDNKKLETSLHQAIKENNQEKINHCKQLVLPIRLKISQLYTKLEKLDYEILNASDKNDLKLIENGLTLIEKS